jgi:dephospho-CoA kinase
MNRPLILGITGGVGSGKTEFSNRLRQLNVPIIDTDGISKELVRDNTEIQQRLKHAFGESIFTSTGELKRNVLAQKVFADRTVLDRLNQIMQAPLNQAIQNEIQSLVRNASPKLIGIDMATLYESKMDAVCDKIIVVNAPIGKRYDWLRKSRKWNREEITDRMRMQWNVDEKKRRADIVIENRDDIQKLHNKARVVFRELLKEIESDTPIRKIL